MSGPARTCCWCNQPNTDGTPFFCKACADVHWAPPPPEPQPVIGGPKPAPPEPTKPSIARLNYFTPHRADAMGYQD